MMMNYNLVAFEGQSGVKVLRLRTIAPMIYGEFPNRGQFGNQGTKSVT
jgi:hypothetical protein